jgi:hypothetical protein
MAADRVIKDLTEEELKTVFYEFLAEAVPRPPGLDAAMPYAMHERIWDTFLKKVEEKAILVPVEEP